MTWIDLTRTIHAELATWPGDPKPELLPANRIENGDSCNTSFLRLNSHLGTHLDAPYHFEEEGKRLQDLPLDPLLGPATLIDLTHKTSHIDRQDLESQNLQGVQRLLIKTSYGDKLELPEFFEDFIGLAPDAAEYVVEKGITLVGIDYLSIEPFAQPEHHTHHTLLQNEVVIVEGLDLSPLSPGTYEFICLPLKIKDCDGSPCRAVAKRITGEN
ncbi:MAG: cyclase family protein [Candidatus Omnitrophica bacterium]|nr:cyclase family protein [Candidatus Omnitrophota bacterium]MCB9766792.1 cyclase family protein [Candidatus Omnitrophota bacterium]